jgi:hypothetical protein
MLVAGSDGEERREKDGRTEEGRTGGRKDGRTDERTGGRTEGGRAERLGRKGVGDREERVAASQGGRERAMEMWFVFRFSTKKKEVEFGIRGKFDKNNRSVGSWPITITERIQILVAFSCSVNKNPGLL